MHYDRKNHVYFDADSNKVDSFSQIIKAVNLVYYPPGMRAATRGTEMHTAIEMYEKGLWIPSVEEEHENLAIKTYKQFKETHVQDMVALELPFIATSIKDDGKEEHLWAGCTDYLFINHADQLCIADFKSGKKYEHHKIQLAAYSYGLMGISLKGYLVYLDENTVDIINTGDYRDYWMAVFMTYYYKKRRRFYEHGRVLQEYIEFPDQRTREIIHKYKDGQTFW